MTTSRRLCADTLRGMRITRLFAVIAAAATVVGLAACSDEAPAVTTVSVADAPSVLDDAGLTVIDVRTPAEYSSGHLAGAINIDVEASGFTSAVGALPKDGEYLVYCHSGNRSRSATAQMAALGFTHVYDLDGGVAAWAAGGGALVTGA